jgi:GntR family transcriptional repressor for pyruvate dehydrogenase complex
MARVTAVKGVLEALKADISRNYKPGDYLPNERLYAERFDVSRNTVREALIFLEAYGFVEKTQRGPRVATPDLSMAFDIIETVFDRSLQTCQDVIEFRRGIDLAVMPSVVNRITDAQISQLRQHLTQMRGALTVHQGAEADYAFHQVLIEASNNSVIRKLFAALRPIIVFYQEIGKQRPHNDALSLDNHQDIVEALEARSLEKLNAAFLTHYSLSEMSLAEALSETQEPKVTEHQ